MLIFIFYWDCMNDSFLSCLQKLRQGVLVVLVVCVAMGLCACSNPQTPYNHYCSTLVEGWEPGDSLKFEVDTLQASGKYQITLGLRTSVSIPYPYQSITLLICQHWHNPERTMRDTVNMVLTDERGDANGSGVSFNQYAYDWKTLDLTAGSCAYITINHLMRSEMLKGISNVGVKLERVD